MKTYSKYDNKYPCLREMVWVTKKVGKNSKMYKKFARLVCSDCGVTHYRTKSNIISGLKKWQGVFSKRCSSCSMVYRNSGEKNKRWKGGIIKSTKYNLVLVKLGHPNFDMIVMWGKNRKYGYVPEHRLVMAGKLGRSLSTDEHVHHINGDKKDNRIENLELMTPDQHTLITTMETERNYYLVMYMRTLYLLDRLYEVLGRSKPL